MDKKKFGQFIKEARMAKGLTQAALAEQLFVDVTAVSKWERGVNYPDITMISDICKILGITEHELIECCRDTEFRILEYNAGKYLRNRKIMLWTYTVCFILAVTVCFIVSVCVSHTLSWFYVVLAGCACGYWATMFWTLFSKLKRRIDAPREGLLSRAGMLIYSAGLTLLTLAILFMSNARSPFDIAFAVKTTLYCFLILFAYGAAELLPAERLIKLGIDSLLTGVYTAGLAVVLPRLMGVEGEDYFDIDFTDWAGHTNGNTGCVILACFAAAGIVLLLCGLAKRRKNRE